MKVNGIDLPAFFAELSFSAQFLYAKQPDPFIALVRLVTGVEIMVTRICEEMKIELDPRATFGHKVQALSEPDILPYKLRPHLSSIVHHRNMVVHAYRMNEMSAQDVEVDMQLALLLFHWYLTDYQKGLRLTVDVAKGILSTVTKPITIDEDERIPRRVFLCHAKEDESKVLELYKRLMERGHKPWMDKRNLLPGQTWELEIRQAIESSDYFIACMSKFSVSKRGYVQKEVRFALDVLGEIPVGKIYLIPILFEPCEIPSTLQALHWIEMDSETAYEVLFQTIELPT